MPTRKLQNGQALVAYLEHHLPAYLADLKTLVSIDSGSFDVDGVNAVITWLAGRLGTMGFEVARHPVDGFGDYLMAVLRGRGRLRVVLLGHADTVFPAGTAAQRPFTIAGDRVLGPGVSDMKGGLLNGLYAVAALQAIGFDDFATLVYLCASDEEVGQHGATPLIQDVSRQADAVFTLEAARANGDIVVARKGIRWYTVELEGRAAHAGVEPEKGASATLALAHHAVALARLNGLRPGVTLNIGTIAGGTRPNVVADRATMRLDVRAFSTEDLEAVEQAIYQQLAQAPVPGVTARAILEEGSVYPPMPRTPAIAHLEGLAQEIAAELGFEVRGAQTGGVSHANLVAAVGTPVLDGLGPVGGRDHSPDEYIELPSIVPRTALLARLIMALAR